MKCSLGISNFLEEISSLSHSIVFLYFFALIPEEGFLISPCYSLELCIQIGISFLFSFAQEWTENISEAILAENNRNYLKQQSADPESTANPEQENHKESHPRPLEQVAENQR